jgi:predicted glycoside hydrolase/deacetylase ChbG (UPF0249 family)
MHIYPDFIDGHQHVHQYKIVRDALFCVHKKVMVHAQHEAETEHFDAFFRNTSNGYQDLFSLKSFPKRQVLSILGGLKFRKMLIAEQYTTNSSFTGIYNFKYAYKYREYFKRFLVESKNGGIIMCHPGILSQDVTDPLHKFRHHELSYFMSDFYLTDMEDMHYNLIFKK